MKLSIIIPVYRTQDTLDRCMESILGQSFTDYEIILVDDGSPDLCPQLCDNYAKQDNRIKVIHKPNGGLSDARNAGIEKAQGEYITFIDSDDAIEEKTLQALSDELSQHPETDILEYPIFERIGNKYKQHLLSFTPHTYTNAVEYWFAEKTYMHTYACNKLYKRTLFEHIRFPKGKTFEDVQTIPYIIGIIQERPCFPTIRVTNKGKYLYYWNNEGITAKARYQDLLNLYKGHCVTLENIWRHIESKPDIPKSYHASIELFLTQILNTLLDCYELSNSYELPPILLEKSVEKLHKELGIKSFKLKLLFIFGYHKLCKINKFLHKIYRHR